MGLLHIAQKKLWVYGLFFNLQGFLNLVGLCFNLFFNHTPVFLINNSLLLLRPGFILQLGSRESSISDEKKQKSFFL